MKKLYLIFSILLIIFSLNNNLKAQNVPIPNGEFKDFLVSNYPSCFVNISGELLMNTSCSEITTEDSLVFHNLGTVANPINLNGIQYFTSLKYLDGSKSLISTFPMFPASLEYLDISGRLNSGLYNNVLPNVLPNSLRHLNISFGYFSTIPLTLPDSLRYFNCWLNMLAVLPTLPSKLDTLNCAGQLGNPPYMTILTSLPTLPQTLKRLECGGNALSHLPSLPEGLIYLDCSSMNVEVESYDHTVQYVLTALPSLPFSLQELNCTQNKLITLPPLPNGLFNLDCSENTTLNSLPQLPNGLIYLILRNTYSLVSLPELPVNLRSLICPGSGIHCIPHIPQSLGIIEIDTSKIKCLPNSGRYSVFPGRVPLCNITNNINQCISSPIISGSVFYDNNSNGIKDAGENYRSSVQVQLSNSQSAYTNINGFFEISADTGVNILSVHLPPYYAANPSSFTYNIGSYDTLISSIIALQPLASVDSMEISIVPVNGARPGFSFNYKINYKNVGSTTIASSNISFNYNSSILTYNQSDNSSVVNSGSSLLLSEENFTPGQQGSFLSNFSVSPDAVLGDTLIASGNIVYNSKISKDSTSSIITGSFDPNDKQATSSLTIQQVDQGTYIDYLVRFQNTGTASAINVVVTDTLNALLNDSSFQLINSSHPCRVTKDGKNVGFEFLNIQLPDSVRNEPASHGFIRFKIKPQPGVALNSVIPNEASIYFDYNNRVLTNTANTSIVNMDVTNNDVLLPEGQFKNFLISNYPSCFVNVDGNGRRLMDTTCSVIINEDSLEFHNLSTNWTIINIVGIQYFKTLKYLNCSENLISPTPMLPTLLEYLDYSACVDEFQQTSLPLLPNGLRFLSLGDNRLTNLPNHLPDSLRYFNCEFNALRSIPTLPSNLEAFICRYQSDGLSGILNVIPSLPSTLKQLNVAGNAINSLPILPDNLEILDCSAQKIPSYPGETDFTLTNLPSILPSFLKYLNCSENGITLLPALPAGLTTLNCSNTQYSTEEEQVVGSGIRTLPEFPSTLTYLSCAYSSIICIPHIPQSLTTIYLDGNNISCLPNSGNYTVDLPLPLCSIINNSHQCVSQPVIAGNIFYDNNSNGIKDAGESFRSNVRVELSNGQSAYSNNNGHYELSADIGTYTLTVDAPSYYAAVPSSFTYTINTYDTLVTALIAFQPIASFDSLNISIVPINTSRPGVDLSYLINYENVGTTTVSPNITFNYNNAILSYNSSSNASVINSGASLTLAEVNLTPGQHKSFLSNFNVSSAAVMGDTLSAYSNISVNSTTSSDSTFSVITGSFDPNDKQGTPKLTPQQVAGGKYIDYLIRFQNTGTDTAFNVVVTDTLDALLNDASFQLVNSSHPCRVTKKDNKVGFEFLNIQLPDSIVNEPASHGFIRFRIKPQPSVTLNTVIPNEASIYFDYNTRVLTNIANTTIAENSAVVVPPTPATISSFAAFTNSNVTSALLRWSTIGEYITNHFEIQEKIGTGNFINIGTEPAIGTGNNSYSHNVTINADGVYFRIKMINTDGSFIYSDEVVVRKTIQSSSTITIFNNPVNNTLRIVNNNASLNNTIAKLINTQGQVVMSVTLTGGPQSIDVRKLASGVYYLKTKVSTDRIRIINH